jgi:putative FmdB family regulatory protein
MPKYEYACAGCHTLFERSMTLAEKQSKIVTCPACGSADIERTFANIHVNRGNGAAEKPEHCAQCPGRQGCGHFEQ